MSLSGISIQTNELHTEIRKVIETIWNLNSDLDAKNANDEQFIKESLSKVLLEQSVETIGKGQASINILQ